MHIFTMGVGLCAQRLYTTSSSFTWVKAVVCIYVCRGVSYIYKFKAHFVRKKLTNVVSMLRTLGGFEYTSKMKKERLTYMLLCVC